MTPPVSERRQENKFIVYTDIVGHTKMLGRLGMAFKPMRERHDELFRMAVRQYDLNAIVKGSGDGFYAATDDVDAAIEIALAFRRSLAHEEWDRFLPEGKKTPDNHIRSRVGIHSGLVRVQVDNGVGVDFDGNPRNVAEKVMSKAQGNQVLVSRQVRDQGSLNFRRNSEVEWKKYGEFKLREVTDTVEIWGLGEAEFPAGPAPTQDPEHRVIIFAVVHDYSVIVEQAGPQFEALKDKWDATLQKAVEAHSKDTFIKRLPEGTIAAFRNAMEAVRAARDFRRMWKAEMRTAIHRLEPKTALDSGLVTFSYENNRANDVRDQPVNMAAKVAKTGLTAAWQLILTRPVREDAFANMPEREEFGWVCIGRKGVPGEPEPVELWDFQDVQVKREDRTLLWIDLAHIRDDLKSRRDVYIKFVTRLDQMLADALTRRGEEAWTLAPDAARIAAFRDPVEAVQAAMDLRAHALSENWAALFQNRGKGWHPLKITLHTGPVRMTSEDGQRKDIKGAPVDGVKLLADAAQMGQLLVSRELKEAVSRHLPETEVRWSKVEVPAKDEVAIEGFELLARQRGVWDKLSPAQRYAAIGAAALVVLGVGVGGAMMASKGGGGGNGRGGGEITGAQKSKPKLEAQTEFNATANPILRDRGKSTDSGSKLITELIKTWQNVLVNEKEMLPPATLDVQSRVKNAIDDLTSGVCDAAAAAQDLAGKLGTLDSADSVDAWLKELSGGYTRLDKALGDARQDDPRKSVAANLSRLQSTLRSLGLASDDPLVLEVEKAGTMDPAVASLPWIGKNQNAIVEATAKANRLLKGELNERVEAKKANQRDPVPQEVADAINAFRQQLPFIASAIDDVVRKRARELDPTGQSSEKVAAALKPMVEALKVANDANAPLDLNLLNEEQLKAFQKADFDGALQLLSEGAKPYRLLVKSYQTSLRKAAARVQGVEPDFTAIASPPEALVEKKKAAEQALAAFPSEQKAPRIARNEAELEAALAKVEAAVAEYETAIAASSKGRTTPGPSKSKEYGPLPADLTGSLAKLAGAGSAGKVGDQVRQGVEAMWRNAEQQRLPRDLAESDLRGVVSKLAQFEKVRGAIDEAALAKDLASLGSPGIEAATIERWLGRVLGYVKIEGVDPRIAAAKQIEEFEKRCAQEKISSSEAPKELADAKRALGRIPVSELPWIEANRNEVKEPAERVAAVLAPGGTVEKLVNEAISGHRSLAQIDQLRQGLDAAVRASPVLETDEPLMFEEWQRFKTRALGVRPSSDTKAITDAAAEAKSLSEFLGSLSSDLKRPTVDSDRTWTASVARALNTQRSAAIKAAIEGRGKPAEAEARKGYLDATARAAAFIKRWRAIEDAFRGGGQLADPVSGFEDKRLGDVINEALGDPLLSDKGDAGVKDALGRLINRAKLLQQIARLDRARGGAFADLVRFADDAQAGFETRVAVWNSMEYGAFSDDREWLTYHKRVFSAVEADLERLGDKVRVDLFKSVLAKDKPKRWFMHVARLSGFDPIDAAMTERAVFGVTDAMLAKAEPEVRWNLRVWKIDSARRRGAAGEQDARAGVGELQGDTGLLEALKANAGAQGFLRELAGAAAGGGGGAGGGVGPAQMGPASADWEFVASESQPGSTLVYQMKPPNKWAPGPEGPKLVFSALNVNGETTYLCTTELSIRASFESMQRAGISTLFLGQFAGTQREGPFAWDFDANKPIPLNLLVGFGGDKGRGMWVKLGDATTQEYFRDGPPAPPDADSPLQYVSLPSAVFMARHLGCRLPTSAEFAAALKANGGVGELSKHNLRDAAYRRQLDSVKECAKKTTGFTDPDKDVYAMTRAAAAGNHAFDDGVAFFAPVDRDASSGPFKHLIGNVAEILCDNAKGMEAIDRNQMPPATSFVTGAAASQFFIAGESAFSEKRDAALGEPRKVNVNPSIKAVTGRGWSDVGMRLAFSPSAFRAPSQVEVDFVTKVKQVFDAAQPYLQARNGPGAGSGG